MSEKRLPHDGARLPWLKVYVRDWLGSPILARLTVEQQGVLWRLLLHAWEQPGCELPAETPFLVTASGLPPHRIEEVERILALCFEKTPDGYLPVEPMDLAAQRAKAAAWRAQKVMAGRRSAEERRQRDGTAQPKPPNVRSTLSNTRSSEPPERTFDVLERTGAGAGAGAGATDALEGKEKHQESEFVESARDKIRAALDDLRDGETAEECCARHGLTLDTAQDVLAAESIAAVRLARARDGLCEECGRDACEGHGAP